MFENLFWHGIFIFFVELDDTATKTPLLIFVYFCLAFCFNKILDSGIYFIAGVILLLFFMHFCGSPNVSNKFMQ